MTNAEYEAASITATKCFDRFEGEHRLKQYDEMITQVEKTLARLQEERRELVNFYNLNKPKCEHSYVWHTGHARWYCPKCEAKK